MKVDGSSTVAPAGSDRRRVPEDDEGRQGHGRRPGPAAALRSSAAADRHLRRPPRPIQQKKSTRPKKNGIDFIELPICFDAPDRRHQQGQHLGRHDDGRRAQEVWERTPPGRSPVEPDPPRVAGTPRSSSTGPGTFQAPDYFTEAVNGKEKASRPTTPPARMTTSWSRASRARRTPSATSASRTTWPTRTAPRPSRLTGKQNKNGPVEPS